MSYLVTGTFDPTTPVSAVSTPSAPYSLAFTVSLPLALVSSNTDSFTTTEPVMFSSGALNFTQSGTVIFYDTAGLGLFDIELPVGGTNYSWVLFGQQIFSGTTSNPTLMPGSFPVDASNSFFWIPGSLNSYPVGGAVTTTPEPGSLILFGSGLVGLAGCKRKFFR